MLATLAALVLAPATSASAPPLARPEMVLLNSVLLLSPEDRKNGGDKAYLVDRALTTSLRGRASSKYLIAIYPSERIRAAYRDSGLAKLRFSPMTTPGQPYPPARAVAYGKSLGADYVGYMAWSKFEMPLLAGAFAMQNHVDVNVRVAFNVFAVGTGKGLGTKIVTLKGTNDNADLEFEKVLFASKATPDSLPGIIGTYMAGKVHADLQTLPFP